jgi:hypothetical protein
MSSEAPCGQCCRRTGDGSCTPHAGTPKQVFVFAISRAATIHGDLSRDARRSGVVSTRDLMPGSSFTPDSKALITSFDGIWRSRCPRAKPRGYRSLRRWSRSSVKLQFEYPWKRGRFRQADSAPALA